MRCGGDDTGQTHRIIGKTIQVDGNTHEVVGVMGPDVRFPAASELYLPMAIDRAHLNTGSFNRDAIARLRPGVTAQAAVAEMTPIIMRLPDDVPGVMTRGMFDQAKIKVLIHPLRDDVVGDIRPILFTVLGTVGFVLLIACANVANLFLVRAEARSKEVAIRSALGASPGSIVTLYLGESLVLSVAGAALGIALAYAALQLLLQLAPEGLPRANEIAMDGRLVRCRHRRSRCSRDCSSAPSRSFAPGKAELTPMLRDGSRGSTSGRERQRVRNAFVVAQVALALMLLVGSGLLARSFQRMRAVDPGFKPDNVLTLRLSIPDVTYRTAGDISRFYYGLMTRIAAVPGVQSVGATTKLPLDPAGNNGNGTWVEDRPVSKNELPSVHPTTNVTQDYFKSMSIPIVEGRTFRDDGSDRAVARGRRGTRVREKILA